MPQRTRNQCSSLATSTWVLTNMQKNSSSFWKGNHAQKSINNSVVHINYKTIFFRLLDLGFNQLVDQPTHIEGNMLDHLYCRHIKTVKVFLHHPYYSDHDSVMALLDIKVSGQWIKSLKSIFQTSILIILGLRCWQLWLSKKRKGP